MADKMTCPACDSYTSDVLRAFRNGEPCPSCGLSNSAAQEVDEARTRNADETLIQKYIEAAKRAEMAEEALGTLRSRVAVAVRELTGGDGL
jgi:DNA replicative helicase MCM subunit Mcm2 (Cdc46/Mcm family)